MMILRAELLEKIAITAASIYAAVLVGCSTPQQYNQQANQPTNHPATYEKGIIFSKKHKKIEITQVSVFVRDIDKIPADNRIKLVFPEEYYNALRRDHPDKIQSCRERGYDIFVMPKQMEDDLKRLPPADSEPLKEVAPKKKP